MGSESYLQAVTKKIKPFHQQAQYPKVKGCPPVETMPNGYINDILGVILEWSELDSFQLDDDSKNQ